MSAANSIKVRPGTKFFCNGHEWTALNKEFAGSWECVRGDKARIGSFLTTEIKTLIKSCEGCPTCGGDKRLDTGAQNEHGQWLEMACPTCSPIAKAEGQQ